jgi:predicted GNAT family N-acyltransferase
MEILNKNHLRDQFDCGEESLTRYLKLFAMQNMRKMLNTCYVHAKEDLQVKAYYTLSNYSLIKNEIKPDTFPFKMVFDHIPTTLLGKLAVDKSMQNQGLGQWVLLDALSQSYKIAMFSASTAVVVEALNEPAATFYQRFGFKLLHENKYYMTMKSIEKLFNDQTT